MIWFEGCNVNKEAWYELAEETPTDEKSTDVTSTEKASSHLSNKSGLNTSIVVELDDRQSNTYAQLICSENVEEAVL